MRIVHFTLGSVDPDSLNGINRVVEGLASTMNRANMAQVSVITVRQKMKSAGRLVFRRDGFTVTACHSTNEALRLFAEIKDQVDLVHIHNVWSTPNIRVGAWLTRQGIPYVLTPHAAFHPDRMTQKAVRKKVFQALFQRNFLDHAAAIIAGSRDEISIIGQFTSNPQIEIVPNGASDINWQAFKSVRKDQKTVAVGYLGRIRREKNILALVEAVKLLPKPVQAGLSVRVFGDVDSDYGLECRQLAHSCGVSNVIKFCGKVTSAQKWEVLGALDAYIQPSLSEAAPLAVLEALSMGLPLVATRTCGISYWHGQPFLTMVEPIAADLARGLETLVNNRAELSDQGAKARAFYEQNFTWDIVAQRQTEIYQACMTKN